jgi:hypothetical protein
LAAADWQQPFFSKMPGLLLRKLCANLLRPARLILAMPGASEYGGAKVDHGSNFSAVHWQSANDRADVANFRGTM